MISSYLTQLCRQSTYRNTSRTKIINPTFRNTNIQFSTISLEKSRQFLFNNLNNPKSNVNSFTINTKRGISFTAVPRFFLRSMKFPITFLGVGAGTAGYINFRLHEATKNFVPDWMTDAFKEASSFLNEAKDEGSHFFTDLQSKFSSFFNDGNNGADVSSFTIPGSSNQPTPNKNLTPQPISSSWDEDKEESKSKRKPKLFKRNDNTQSDDQFSPLIRKLIEIRAILKAAGPNHSLHMPAIVVIGSQSSGKSSVLEAIVGREFLPKGGNMVTRRPIELTLVHSPELEQEYGVIPQVSKNKVYDFEQIQASLATLNQQVSSSECVSDNPIELKIYSPNVPDLTLIDLPGYIQVHTKDQPRTLKKKISDLCHRYISQPNVILAVCPADVDLANSEALLASRRVDPNGHRTLGVVSKLDLVEPALGVSILENQDYPLKLGYIGVICKPTGRGDSLRPAAPNGVPKQDPFASMPIYRHRNLRVGVPNLRRTLIEVLEDRMGQGLQELYDTVQTELEEVRYQYKVEYNDRLISPESYVAESMDVLKIRFKDFTESFGKAQIKEQIQALLQQKVMDVAARVYWSDPNVTSLSKAGTDDPAWSAKLDRAAALLTKSGVGKLSTQLVVDTLMQHMDRISRTEPFVHHEAMRRQIIQFSDNIVKSKLKSTVDQVENTIKPYKFEVDCNQQEWQEAQQQTTTLLKQEIQMVDTAISKIKQNVGSAKLKSALYYLQQSERQEYTDPLGLASLDDINGDVTVAPFSTKLLDKAREVQWLKDRRMALKFRLAVTKSRPCRTSSNKTLCPEVYLSMVGTKLTGTAVMFIQVELLNEVFFQFPREVDTHLLYRGLATKEQATSFALQNPKVKRQLELFEARKQLEIAVQKLRYMLNERNPSIPEE